MSYKIFGCFSTPVKQRIDKSWEVVYKVLVPLSSERSYKTNLKEISENICTKGHNKLNAYNYQWDTKQNTKYNENGSQFTRVYKLHYCYRLLQKTVAVACHFCCKAVAVLRILWDEISWYVHKLDIHNKNIFHSYHIWLKVCYDSTVCEESDSF